MAVVVLYSPPKSQKIVCRHCDSVLAFSKADYNYDEDVSCFYIICPECDGFVFDLQKAQELDEYDIENLQQLKERS